MTNGDILPFEVMARKEDWSEGISLYGRQVIYGVETAYAMPLVMQKLEPKNHIAEPFMRLSIQTGQQLMDELWKCGLRPTEGAGSAGSLAATQRHLEDMRTLVFKNIKRS